MSRPSPVLPAYGRGSLPDVVPALLGPTGTGMPGWMPAAVHGAHRTVLFLVDGLGWNQLRARPHLAPVLTSFAGGPVTSVAPTTTATALTSVTTGLTPGEHGIIGYRMDMGGTVMNTLRWAGANGDMTRVHPPLQVQACPAFMGASVPVVSRADLEDTSFTAAHLNGVRAMGWRVASSIPVIVSSAGAAGESFVDAYYDGLDKVAHEHGFGPHYDAELRFVDWLVGRMLEALPSGTALLVTADHGQVHVGDNTRLLDDDVASLVHRQSGEGRFRWLHARQGRESALLEECGRYDDIAWVAPREQVLDEGWFGPRATAAAARRMGDVALVPHAPVSFDDPAEGSHFSLVCRHGSLTEDEMLVPLVAARAG
ncbi:MAG: alkaline phosphatase family protein [Ilumatobacteraceae bacterium]